MMMKKALQGVAVNASKRGSAIASTSNILAAAGGGGGMKKAPLFHQPLTRRASTLATTKSPLVPPPSAASSSTLFTRPLSTFLSSTKSTRAVRLSSSSPRPLGLLSTSPLLSQPHSHSHTRAYNTQATTTTTTSRKTTLSPYTHTNANTHTHTQHRHFWSPRFLRELGLPWFVQAFYGTLFVIGIAVLAVTLFTASSVLAFLFLLAFAGFKLFSKQPHLARQVMRRPSPESAAGRMFGPLLEMMTDGMMLDGLKNARGAIERDVLGVINTHPTLRKMGQDFRTTGLHKMSMQQVNGEKHVMMEFLVVSSLPREMFVQVVATRTKETVQVEGQEEEQEKWNFESAVVRTPDGTLEVDLTPVLLKKAGGKRTIIIDVPPSREK